MTSPPDVQNVEIERLRSALTELLRQVETFCEKNGEADFETHQAREVLGIARGTVIDSPLVRAEKRVAELEERLMVMCVAQLTPPEPACFINAKDLAAMHEGQFHSCLVSAHRLSANNLSLYDLKQSRPSPDSPAPAPLAAQGVEGDPHH